MRTSYLLLVGIAFTSACVPAKQNPKYLFSDGVYKMKSTAFRGKAYVQVNDTEVRIFNRNKSGSYDTVHYQTISLEDTAHAADRHYRFEKSSLDIDLISLPLKFRTPQAGIPSQLNATINGGLYAGRRTDYYRLSRHRNELGIDNTSVQHYGLSYGFFTGIGSAVMNPSVTANRIENEYDAVIIPWGITVLAGYNNLTFGLAGGFDHMLNNHRKYWIYDRKPWLGLTVGLNLN